MRIADVTGDAEVSCLIERALDQAKADLYPTLDLLIELRPKRG
jgi:hypothetical protein